MFNRRDGGMQALGPMKWLEPVNWKTHGRQLLRQLPRADQPSLQRPRCRPRFLGRPRLSHKDQFESPNKHAFVNGHSLTFRDADDNMPALRARRVDARPSSCSRTTTTPRCPRSSGGSARSARAGCSSATTRIFPNGILGFRLALPRGPLKTEFWHFVLLDRDAPEELKRAIRIGSQANNGAAGMFEQDDVDNWRQVTEASTSRLGRRLPAGSVDGPGPRGPHPDYPGLVSERYISENNQRLFYQRWEEFMNAESWADIPLDPITRALRGHRDHARDSPIGTSAHG